MSGYVEQDDAQKRLDSEHNLVNRLEKLRGGNGAARVVEDRSGETSRVEPEVAPQSAAPSAIHSVITPEVLDSDDIRVAYKKIRDSGRREGDVNVPQELRVINGVLANLIGVTGASEITGVSKGQTSQHAHGRNGATTPNPELAKAVESKVDKIKDKALDKLMTTLDFLTDDEIQLGKKEGLVKADIATKLAGVADKLTPKQPGGTAVAQVIVYTPRIKDESEYEMIPGIAVEARH